MRFKRNMLLVALATVWPMVGVYAQSTADLQKEISTLRFQLQLLQKKVEEVSSNSEAPVSSQQLNRIEQKVDLAEDTAEKAGLRGLNFKGVIEAAFRYDNMAKVRTFAAQSGNGSYDSVTPANSAMLELTKETEGGEGINWTLRLEPGLRAASSVHEASISFPVNANNRVIAGVIPDWTGYEYYFAHQNPLITHNALFDFTAAVNYSGVGMSHTLNSKWTAKWVVGNIDGGNDEVNMPSVAPTYTKKTTGLAVNLGWAANEFAFLQYSGVFGGTNRKFNMHEVSGSYTRGDWLSSGQVGLGRQRGAAANTDDAGNAKDASWWTLSGLVGYKVTPRLQLLARADYIYNKANGGGTYSWNGDQAFSQNYGLGTARNSDGSNMLDANGNPVGANLIRSTLGTNYQVNRFTQWKTEFRIDRSSGYNFTRGGDGTDLHKQKTSVGTSLVVSF